SRVRGSVTGGMMLCRPKGNAVDSRSPPLAASTISARVTGRNLVPEGAATGGEAGAAVRALTPPAPPAGGGPGAATDGARGGGRGGGGGGVRSGSWGGGGRGSRRRSWVASAQSPGTVVPGHSLISTSGRFRPRSGTRVVHERRVELRGSRDAGRFSREPRSS